MAQIDFLVWTQNVNILKYKLNCRSFRLLILQNQSIMINTINISVRYVILAIVVFMLQGSSFTLKKMNDDHPEFVLKVEGRTDWVVTDEPYPRLSWTPVGKINGRLVAGYEVIIASDSLAAAQGKGTLWESGFLPVTNGPWVLFKIGRAHV